MYKRLHLEYVKPRFRLRTRSRASMRITRSWMNIRDDWTGRIRRTEIPRLFHFPAHQWEDPLRQRAPFGQFGSGENHRTDPATAFSSNAAEERYRSIYAFVGDKDQPNLVKAAKGLAGMTLSARYRQLSARQPGKRWHALNASRVADQPLAFPTQAQALCRERDGECMHGIRVLFPAFDREVFGVSARDRGCGTNRDHTKICDGGRSDAGAHRVA